MQVPVMPSRPHEDAVVESFRDDLGFALYMLNRSLEEGDEAVFLNTLRRVAKAFGGISQVARQANLNETTIYRLLSGQGNPQLSSIMAILRVMGLRLAESIRCRLLAGLCIWLARASTPMVVLTRSRNRRLASGRRNRDAPCGGLAGTAGSLDRYPADGRLAGRGVPIAVSGRVWSRR